MNALPARLDVGGMEMGSVFRGVSRAGAQLSSRTSRSWRSLPGARFVRGSLTSYAEVDEGPALHLLGHALAEVIASPCPIETRQTTPSWFA